MQNPLAIALPLVFIVGVGAYLLFGGGDAGEPEPAVDEPTTTGSGQGIDVAPQPAIPPAPGAPAPASPGGATDSKPPEETAASGTPTEAGDPDDAKPRPLPNKVTDTRVASLKWRRAKITTVVSDLKALAGVEVKARGAVEELLKSRSVSMQVEDVPVSTVMTMLATLLGVAWTEQDGVIWLHTPDDPPPAK